MIELEDITLAYGSKKLFDEVSGIIHQNDRIGLVGANGSGKSTFFRLLKGDVESDRGTVTRASYASLGYLPQEGIEVKGRVLHEEVASAFADAISLQAKIDAASERMYDMDPSTEEYYELVDTIGGWEQEMEDHEPAKMRSRIERTLHGLGFSPADLERDTGEFSGGWQMRIALAKLLVANPALLLLDEPTNHLDVFSQHWLEAYLSRYRGALMVISHDKAFLDVVTTRTWELKFGALNPYPGNYSAYEKLSSEKLARQRKAASNQKKEIARQKEFINRFRSNQKKAGLVQSRLKQLDKVEVIKPEREEKRIWFRFPPPPPPSHKVVEIKELHKAYGDNVIFHDFNLRLTHGDRMAIVGINGAGKSTLARILAGVEPYQAGEREEGINTVIGYFAQQQAEELDPDNTVLQEIQTVLPDESEDKNPRAVLGALLFTKDDQHKPVSVLSGGERNRVALAKMLMRPANCIILDEPTNHLDIRSKAVLQEAIKDFDGTVIIVSHDRDFLDPVVDKVLEVRPDGTRLLTCNVSGYIERIEREAARDG